MKSDIAIDFIARRICARNLETLYRGLVHYSNENDGRLPMADNWCDAIIDESYITEETFNCPQTQHPKISYAFNKYLSNLKISELSNDTIVLFESFGGWNFNGDQNVVAPRHVDSLIFFVVTANGDALMVSRESIKKLLWKPLEQTN